ncbi:hypothetical protein [Ruminiclostridium papyrosolvens]|uniref:Uncharacterized protein n=1 Tax=Ruminiclostridium papyrosolvens C7 TaxID=1330534 RepID=U4QY87_9FIRM|nr:hypothetical protein [Ruminiclostridium papyrosolvens]EPR08024.1 hypothetical protein L323_18800 [Ruminiclostridium papyrosolvens C7]
MSDGCGCGGGISPVANWGALLANYVGETVTIFTSSGGQSGSGFTGVILTVNPVFVRLISRIGPPPGCSLGNSCSGFSQGGYGGGYGAGYGCGSGYGAGGWSNLPVYTVGSVVDIPIAAIVSFVHNAI